MEDVGIFYVHLVNIPAFWSIFQPFGIFYGNLAYFTPFGMLYQEKSGNPAPQAEMIPLCTNVDQADKAIHKNWVTQYIRLHICINN
jgi:hypothetical protein